MVGLVVAAFVVSGVFFLGGTGGALLTITPLQGASSTTGAVADIIPMSSSVTRSNGAAQLQTGVAISKVNVAKSATASIQIGVTWTNVTSALNILNTPHAQISVGVYHPIHTGVCVTGSGGSVDSPLVNVTDTDSTVLCTSLDQASTGTPSVSTTGKLLISTSLIAGFIRPALDGSGTLSACASAANDSGGWCQPASVTDVNQRALFMVASIVTPGVVPQGQQAGLSTLTFFTDVRRTK